MYFNRFLSLARKFKIEGGEPNRERLENWAGERDIHVEVVFADAPELHINVVIVVFVYQLKVFYGRFVYPSVEIKHESLDLCRKISANSNLHSFHLGGLLKKNIMFSVLFTLNCSCIVSVA